MPFCRFPLYNKYFARLLFSSCATLSLSSSLSLYLFLLLLLWSIWGTFCVCVCSASFLICALQAIKRGIRSERQFRIGRMHFNCMQDCLASLSLHCSLFPLGQMKHVKLVIRPVACSRVLNASADYGLGLTCVSKPYKSILTGNWG